MSTQTWNAPNSYRHDVQLIREFDQSVWSSLKSNLRDVFFPENLPPLALTSRPVRVRDIWGEYSNKKRGAAGTIMLHAIVLSGIIWYSLVPHHPAEAAQKTQVVDLVTPDISVYQPVIKPQEMAGGGGGGDRAKIEAPKGKLPKVAPEQFTPPAIVVRNDHPKLPVEPSVVLPPQIKLAEANVPTLGLPASKISGPASNGIGSNAGIGSGASGGVGSGVGAGVGPGSGGGFGGGVFHIGGSVTAPRVLYQPDPEYTEEARKAKYQGVCVIWLIVGPDGHPRDVRVARTLGMGLDQKAIEAVRQWKFEPAMKDGKPVAVQLNVEVNFRLY